MYHPLIEDISNLSIEAANLKMSELQKKLQIAYRTGNMDLMNQLQMVIAMYQDHINTKTAEQMKEINNRNQGPDDKIDIS